MTGSSEYAHDMEERFKVYVEYLLRERIDAICFVGAFVFPCFVLEDQILAPDRWQEMLVARISCSLLCVMTMVVSKTKFSIRRPFTTCMIFMAAIGFTKTLATSIDITGIDALYLGGHILLLVGALGFLPLTLMQAAILGAIGIAGFAAPTLLFADHIIHEAFMIQISLMATVVFLLSISCHLNYRMRFREFDLMQRLHSARQRLEEYD